MDKFMSRLYVFSLLSALLMLVTSSHAVVTPEVYWNSVLPKSPMPKALKNVLNNAADSTDNRGNKLFKLDQITITFKHQNAPSNEQLNDKSIVTLFFLEDSMHEGGYVDVLFKKSKNHQANFLSQQVANSMPFSSTMLPNIYKKFSMNPASKEANAMRDTIRECEDDSGFGEGEEEKYCAASLESIIDFSTTKLGKKVKAISTDIVNINQNNPLQKYRIEKTKKLASRQTKTVVCHKENYPYAVFYCHTSINARVYAASLVGLDGAKVDAIAVCHADTSYWNPNHLAFQVLKVNRGTVPVCHFLPEDHVVWVPY